MCTIMFLTFAIAALKTYAYASIFQNEEIQTLVHNETVTKNLPHPDKPNILLILADDVGTGDVPGYWNTGLVNMPNLQDLVAKGVTFTDAHSTPLCAPSRYLLLSGNYPHRGRDPSGTWFINYKGNQFKRSQKSIANVLRDNGYNTGMFGKWHLGGKVPTKRGFNAPNHGSTKQKTMLTNENHDWSKRMKRGPKNMGFNKSYFTLSGIQNCPYVFFRNDNLKTEVSDVKFWIPGNYSMPEGESIIDKEGEGSKDWDSSAYNMILVNETKRFIRIHRKKKRNDPFFAYVALGSVHEPHSPPHKYMDGSPVANEYHTRHMDLLGEMDKVVGSLMEYLKRRGLLDNTIVIFTSDNGGLGDKGGGSDLKAGHISNGPLRDNKGSVYEGGHRIPMTIQWKGHIPEGQTRSHLVGLNDLYSTLCDVAGVQVPPGQAKDSVTFADYIFNGTNTDGLREYLATWRFSGGKLISQAVRKDNMKLIHHYKNDTLELYDLEEDLSESTNIASTNIQFVDEMYQQLVSISPCGGDSPIIPECIKQ